MTRLLKILRPAWLSISLIILLTFFQTLSTLYLPRLMAKMVDQGVVKGNMAEIFAIGTLMLIVTFLAAVFSIGAGYLASKTSAEFGRIVRGQLFRHVESLMPHEFDQFGTSSLIVRSTNDVMQVQQFVNMLLRMMVIAPLMAVGGIIMAVTTNAKLSTILVVVLPLLALGIYLILKRGLALFHLMQEKVDVLNRIVRENLTGVRVIRAFNRDSYEQSRFERVNGDLTQVSIRVYTIMALFMPLVMMIINLSTVAILWFGGREVGTGTLQVGNLMAFIQYISQIMFSIMMVSAMFFMIPRAQASAARINEVLNLVPSVTNRDDMIIPTLTTSSSTPLIFDRVSFRYPGAEDMVLSRLSFDVPFGQITAIVGGTGSGKTALLNLIPRFFDVSEGAILLHGIDIRNLPQQFVRSKIAYVSQNAVIFSGTIADNIRFGNPEASDEDIEEAARIAQALEFIERLPDGFQSPVTQNGNNLSGGQKQRLAIARALVKKADIYLFDDSFSALDYQTDQRLQEALRESLREAAIIVVSQRVQTVIDADQILVLDKGQIVGRGRHETLMQSSVVYQEFVRSQLSEEAS
ncbi:ABC transporter ATP-binding protein [Sulfobacillus thermosulfidooxidans]|uniref:ABC transporter ATP-binding protein n=1 Tax=Sulfobacillus thermosulfidooxidans TaxID=28034 RepID=UPI0006B4B228|nr:ABC transporter ATP-binding protein [Sulfobacillus thermosulfidooxidans]